MSSDCQSSHIGLFARASEGFYRVKAGSNGFLDLAAEITKESGDCGATKRSEFKV